VRRRRTAHPPISRPKTPLEDEEEGAAVQRLAADEEELLPLPTARAKGAGTGQPAGDGTSAGSRRCVARRPTRPPISLRRPLSRTKRRAQPSNVSRLTRRNCCRPPTAQARALEPVSPPANGTSDRVQQVRRRRLTHPPISLRRPLSRTKRRAEPFSASPLRTPSSNVMDRTTATPPAAKGRGEPHAGCTCCPGRRLPQRSAARRQDADRRSGTLRQGLRGSRDREGPERSAPVRLDWATRAGGRDDPNSPEAHYWMGILLKADQAVARWTRRPKTL